MSDSHDARLWLNYAQENREVSAIVLETGFFNPCLQNVQQAVEKALKAVTVMQGLSPLRTHRIRELVDHLKQHGTDVPLKEDEYDLRDSIYVASKYPPESALPDTMPDEATCRLCLEMTDRVLSWANAQVSS